MNRHLIFTATILTYQICSSCLSVQPKNPKSIADSSALKTHVKEITQHNFRNYKDTAALNRTAEYIEKEFLKHSRRVSFQTYKLDGREYKNVICSLGPDSGKRLIIGAHYDVSGNQPGADDNASGVAGVLELARLLKNQNLRYRTDLVAYTLEEPPYFRTNGMGSFIHARDLRNNNIAVKGMICLEMIGYFNNSPNSQKYPIGFMKWFYGGTGNYILIVQKFANGKFGRQFNRQIRKNAAIKTKFIRSPKSLTGIDFSDHRNYWHFGYDALMITNTAFYRNNNYHTSGDIPETLDFTRMSKVIDQVYLTILKL